MRAAFAIGLLAWCSGALACGYCAEDKIASVYDHAVVTRALAARHHVAFLHVEGAAPRPQLQEALSRTPGVERASVRISADLLTVSFAFDPRRASLGALHSAMDRRLARHGVSLMPFQVMEKPGDLKIVKK